MDDEPSEGTCRLLVGATFEDLADYLQKPDPGGYPIDVVRECICRTCGGKSFEIQVIDGDSAARRSCLACGAREFIADSQEYWDDAEGADYVCACPCGAEEFAGAVGFPLREDGQDVRWVFVGLRCLVCGLLGIYEDWKINYGPSLHLLDQA